MSIKEKISTVRGKVEKARELLMGPRFVEFENGIVLETSVRGEKPDIKLNKNGEVVEDFNAMVPEDIGLEFDPEGRWRIEGRTMKDLVLYVGKFKGADAIAIFLHEIGHLQNREDMELVERLEQLAQREKRIDWRNAYPGSRLKAMAEEKKWVIRIERDAWAFALRKVRELEKKHGITIFDRLEGEGGLLERVKDFVNTALQNHEQVYLDELYNIDIYTKEDMEKLFNSLE